MAEKKIVKDGKSRCWWCGDDPEYVAYHDTEWGVPIYDDLKLFELLNLEGAQAGLSWITILRKRENYREAFDNFDPEKIAQYDETKIAELLNNEGIVRNKLKVHGVVTNARLFMEMRESGESFSKYLWSFVDGKPIQNSLQTKSDVQANTVISDEMCKSLKKRGFKFIGSTICYAFMQSAGMVNDHLVDCFRYEEC
jgi:DNA-3-methyladenine glycosylase I